MKFFACLFVLAAIATIALADQITDKKTGLVGSSYGAPAQSYGAPAASYAAPPCAKNYLFSCQPNLAPVPCSSGGSSGGYGSAGAAGGSSGGYGSAGAYSQYVPQYAYPQYAYPQYAPQY